MEKGKEEFHLQRNGIKCAGGKLLFRVATSVAFIGKNLTVACMLGCIMAGRIKFVLHGL